MTKKIVFAVALALVIVGIAAPSASAACNPPKFAATYNGITGGYVYWHTSIVGGTLHGEMWSGSTAFTGTCNTNPGSSFLYFGIDPQTVGLSVSLGDVCVPGCPSGNLAVKATVTDPVNGNQESVAMQEVETPSGGLNFDFSGANGPYNTDMVRPHRPRVSASSRSAGTIDLFSDPGNGYQGGAEGNLAQCIIRSTTSASAPASSAIPDWPTVLATLPAVNGVCPAVSALPIDCTSGVGRWVAVQYVDTVGGPGQSVGDGTLVSCSPALAEPKKPVSKKPGIGHTRQ